MFLLALGFVWDQLVPGMLVGLAGAMAFRAVFPAEQDG
jgi:hypothetical protein